MIDFEEVKTLIDECNAMIKEGVEITDLGLQAWREEVLAFLRYYYGVQSDEYAGFEMLWGAHEFDDGYDCKRTLEASRGILRSCMRKAKYLWG